jgi:hypothetical protein
MKTELRCPRCFQPLSRCRGEHDPLPTRFAQTCRDTLPTWIVQAGYTRHGKTVFLAAMTLMLEELGAQLPGFTCDYMGDPYTFDTLREMRSKAAEQRVDGATPRRFPQPLFLQVRSDALGPTRRSSARTLILYDTAGEFFTNVDSLRENVPAVTHADLLWLLVSLSDLEQSGEHLTLTDLFQSYRSAMEQEERDLTRAKIVVILTKADCIEHRITREVGDEVNNYLADDPFSNLTVGNPSPLPDFSLVRYMERAAKISDLLQEFVRRQVPGGRNFVQLAENQGVSLRFCICSALGHQPELASGRFVERAIRYRVLDPFFWTIWLQSGGIDRTPEQRLYLVLDAATDSSSVFVDDRPAEIWEALSRRGDTATYHLGQLRPVTMLGQRPSSEPPWRKRPRFLGPILESLPREARVLVVTSGAIRDLHEFKNSPWRDRVLVAVTKDELRDIWPHTWPLRDSDDYHRLVDQLLELQPLP